MLWALCPDVADNTFGDWRVYCTEETDEKSPQLLKEELEANEKFYTECKRAEEKWNKKKNE